MLAISISDNWVSTVLQISEICPSTIVSAKTNVYSANLRVCPIAIIAKALRCIASRILEQNMMEHIIITCKNSIQPIRRDCPYKYACAKPATNLQLIHSPSIMKEPRVRERMAGLKIVQAMFQDRKYTARTMNRAANSTNVVSTIFA